MAVSENRHYTALSSLILPTYLPRSAHDGLTDLCQQGQGTGPGCHTLLYPSSRRQSEAIFLPSSYLATLQNHKSVIISTLRYATTGILPIVRVEKTRFSLPYKGKILMVCDFRDAI